MVPLFETLDDLDNAGQIMRRLFNIPWYRTQLRWAPLEPLWTQLLLHPP